MGMPLTKTHCTARDTAPTLEEVDAKGCCNHQRQSRLHRATGITRASNKSSPSHSPPPAATPTGNRDMPCNASCSTSPLLEKKSRGGRQHRACGPIRRCLFARSVLALLLATSYRGKSRLNTRTTKSCLNSLATGCILTFSVEYQITVIAGCILLPRSGRTHAALNARLENMLPVLVPFNRSGTGTGLQCKCNRCPQNISVLENPRVLDLFFICSCIGG